MTRPIRPLLLAVMLVASVGLGFASGSVAAQDQGPSVDFSGCSEVTVTGEEYRITLYYEGGDIEDDNGPYNGTNTFNARDGKTIRKVSVSGNSGMKTAENPNYESCTGTTSEPTTTTETTTTTTESTTSTPTTTETTTATTTTTTASTTTTPTDGGSEPTTTMTTTENQFDPDVEFDDCQTVTVNADEYDGVTLYFGAGDIADYVGPYTGENTFSARSDAQDQPLRKVSISSGDGMTTVENPNYESCLEEMGATETETPTESTEQGTTTAETDSQTDDGTDAQTDGGTDAQTDAGGDSSPSNDAGGDDATDQQADTETGAAESTSTTDEETTAEPTTDTTTAATTDESSTEQAVSDDGQSTASTSADGQETQNGWFADLLQLKYDSGRFAFSLMGAISLVAAGVLTVR